MVDGAAIKILRRNDFLQDGRSIENRTTNAPLHVFAVSGTSLKIIIWLYCTQLPKFIGSVPNFSMNYMYAG